MLLVLGHGRRLGRWGRRALSMAETALVISVGGALLIAVLLGVQALLDRLSAREAGQGFRSIVELVWELHRTSASYDGLTSRSVAQVVPERLTDPARAGLYLGADLLPVYLGAGNNGGTAPRQILLGVENHARRDAESFFVRIGDATDPIRSAALCSALLTSFEVTHSRLLGIHVSRAAGADATVRQALFNGDVNGDVPLWLPPLATTERFIARSVELAGLGAPQPGSGGAYMRNGDVFHLHQVLGSHLDHVCDVAADEDFGASLFFAFR